MAAALRPCRAPLATLARIDRLAAQRPPQNVTLNELQERMAKTSKTASPAAFVREARWLQEELPLRMAQLLADFNRLPFVALRCEPLADVWSIYWQELEALSALPRAESSDYVVRLKDELLLSQERRSGVIEAFRQAVGELRRFPDVQSSLEAFLDKAFVARIGRLMLEDHFVAFVELAASGDSGGQPRSDGIVSEVRLVPLLEDVAADIRDLSERVYGCSPKVEIVQTGDGVVHNIPRYLGFIFREILKNAVKATVERHPVDTPAVQVHVVTGTYDVQVRISDLGGGMPRRVLKSIWRYGFSGFEVSHPKQETAAGVMDGGHGSQSQTELSGYGVGLPLSRLYARHLGGDIVISQVLGHGTEASVFLSRHGIREDFCLGDSEEPAAETHGALRGRDSMRAPF